MELRLIRVSPKSVVLMLPLSDWQWRAWA